MSEPQTTLSASRIKTAQGCSWLYWCKYKLKLPDASNDGAKRGSICHLIFELLGEKRRRGEEGGGENKKRSSPFSTRTPLNLPLIGNALVPFTPFPVPTNTSTKSLSWNPTPLKMAKNSSPTLPSIKNRYAKFLTKDEIKK